MSNCVITTFLGNARMMAREGQRGGALDQGGQGLSNSAELLLTLCHPLCSAECLDSPPEEDQNFQEGNFGRPKFPGRAFKNLSLKTHRAGSRLSRSGHLNLAPWGWMSREKEEGLVEGCCPFLGTFVTDLLMLDIAMEEYLEGNAINHQKNKLHPILSAGAPILAGQQNSRTRKTGHSQSQG